MNKDSKFRGWLWRQKQRLVSYSKLGDTVIFHIGRSGSTVLAELLKQHPAIAWDGEIYEHYFRRYEKRSGKTFSKLHTPDKPFKILSRQKYLGGAGWYGFEVKFFHLEMFGLSLERFISELQSQGVTKFIILERKNHFRKIVSSVIAHKENRFHRSAASKTRMRKIEIDPQRIEIDRTSQSLMSFLKLYRDGFRQLRAILSDQIVLELNYEDHIFGDPRKAYTKAVKYLELDEHHAEVTLSKTNPYSLCDIISNFEEVIEYLAETEFSWMLELDRID